MFAASLQLTVDYDALIETDSHNDDQQEDKNDYREDDGTTFYRDRPRSRKAADEGKMQGAMTALVAQRVGSLRRTDSAPLKA